MHKRTIYSLFISFCCITAFATAGEDPVVAFRDECAKQAAAGDTMAVAGADGWLFRRTELRHAGPRQLAAPGQGRSRLSRGQEGGDLVLHRPRVHREFRLVTGAVLVRRQAGRHSAINCNEVGKIKAKD